MIGKVIGALVGRKIDQSDGKGGVKGAMFGMMAAGVLRRMGPLGLVLGGAYFAKKAYDLRRGRESDTSEMVDASPVNALPLNASNAEPPVL